MRRQPGFGKLGNSISKKIMQYAYYIVFSFLDSEGTISSACIPRLSGCKQILYFYAVWGSSAVSVF